MSSFHTCGKGVVTWFGLALADQRVKPESRLFRSVLSVMYEKGSQNYWFHSIANLRTREKRLNVSLALIVCFLENISKKPCFMNRVGMFIFLPCTKIFQLMCSNVVTWKLFPGISCFWQFQVRFTWGWNLTYSSHPQGNNGVDKMVDILMNA